MANEQRWLRATSTHEWQGQSEYPPRWLPDGGNNYVVFLRPRHALWLLEVEAGEARLVIEEVNVDYMLLHD